MLKYNLKNISIHILLSHITYYIYISSLCYSLSQNQTNTQKYTKTLLLLANSSKHLNNVIWIAKRARRKIIQLLYNLCKRYSFGDYDFLHFSKCIQFDILEFLRLLILQISTLSFKTKAFFTYVHQNNYFKKFKSLLCVSLQ